MRRLLLLAVVAVLATVAGAVATSKPLPSTASVTVLTANTARLHGIVSCASREGCRYFFRWRTFSGPDQTSAVLRIARRLSRAAVSVLITGLRRHTRYGFALCVAEAQSSFGCVGPPGEAQGTFTSAACDRYASPRGSHLGSGTLIAPLDSVAALDRRLAPGQIGCLTAGSYGTASSAQRLLASGTPRQQITITHAPHQRVTLHGLVELEGAYTTVSGLRIDGANSLYTTHRSGTDCQTPVSNGLEIDGRGVIFENNDYYQSVPSLRGNGIGIGWNTPADGAIIRNNRIHDLGQCQAYDQMIYLAHGTGVQIYGNWMWNDPHGWGVQIYPGAANAHIHDNVIDAAGSGFVIAGYQARDNMIDHNVIIGPTGLPAAGLRRGVGISTVGAIGSGNAFTHNVVYRARGGIATTLNIRLSGNTTRNPELVNPRSHDYRLARPSGR